MQAILDMFDERVQEIDLYFEAIKELDRGSIGHATDTHYFNEEFIKWAMPSSSLKLRIAST